MYLIKNRSNYQFSVNLCDEPTERDIIVLAPNSVRNCTLTDEQVIYIRNNYKNLIIQKQA